MNTGTWLRSMATIEAGCVSSCCMKPAGVTSRGRLSSMVALKASCASVRVLRTTQLKSVPGAMRARVQLSASPVRLNPAKLTLPVLLSTILHSSRPANNKNSINRSAAKCRNEGEGVCMWGCEHPKSLRLTCFHAACLDVCQQAELRVVLDAHCQHCAEHWLHEVCGVDEGGEGGRTLLKLSLSQHERVTAETKQGFSNSKTAAVKL